MNRITINYGTESHTHTFAGSITVGEVLRNSTIKAVLGFGDNVRSLVSGVEQGSDAMLRDGMVVVVETKANSKAS